MNVVDMKKSFLKWVNNGEYMKKGFQFCWIDAELAATQAIKNVHIDPDLCPYLRSKLTDLYLYHYLDTDGNLKSEYRSVAFSAFLLCPDREWYGFTDECDFYNLLGRCLDYDFRTWDYVKNYIRSAPIEIPQSIMRDFTDDDITEVIE